MKLRRFLFLLWAGLLVAAAACAQPVSTLYDKTEYRIAMRDSVRLHTSVFTSARSAGCGVLPSFFAWLMRDFAWLISMRFAFTLRFTML